MPDEILLAAVDRAREALAEITPAATIGAPAGHLDEGDGVVSLLFENTMPGYPGWFWTVSLSRDPATGSVNVLETELMPGERALLAPEWVPWADRLAEYQAQQQALRDAAAAAGEEPPIDELAVVAASESEDDLDDDLDEGDLDTGDEDDDLDDVDDVDDFDGDDLDDQVELEDEDEDDDEDFADVDEDGD
ncbi:DUF3027 domain-containing protein [Gryllotalpicola sp.]|uniref:DUF3027 domain-containing protein n=1 Tax=Gryllotalpicola sp. TaxID=1932787 RepID=UPI002617567F|nr:DUF3027 domain-containing protein [Gryllotalpicola sp.]